MTAPNAKPRAGEHTKIGAGALRELIADYRHLAWPEDDRAVEAMRLDLIERALREHSNKMKTLEAERDVLAAQNREILEALRSMTSGLADHLKARTVRCDSCAAEVAQAREILAKHGR